MGAQTLRPCNRGISAVRPKVDGRDRAQIQSPTLRGKGGGVRDGAVYEHPQIKRPLSRPSYACPCGQSTSAKADWRHYCSSLGCKQHALGSCRPKAYVTPGADCVTACQLQERGTTRELLSDWLPEWIASR